jgi:NTE family protein
MAYHAGVLHALEEAGVELAGADLIIGTSAGSVIGALLRTGWRAGDLWAFAQGTHPAVEELEQADRDRRRRDLFRPSWSSPGELARRAVGSTYVAVRSVARFPGPRLPKLLRRGFPGGLFSMTETEKRLAELLPAEWPERPLWLCAVDIGSGRRIVLGRPGSPEAPLPRGVLASCAIPGVYRPVTVDGLTLVDGGAHSTTNLDLAAKDGCRLILCVAPMSYDPVAAPGLARQLVRRVPSRALRREVTFAREDGAEVLIVRPTATELRVHGMNMMRPDGAERVAEAARSSALRFLETDRARDFLDRLAARQLA